MPFTTPNRQIGAPPRVRGSVAMTTLRLNSALAAELLLAHLHERAGIVAQLIGPNTVSVSLLGSFHLEAMELEIVLLVRVWEAAARAKGLDVRVQFEETAADESPRGKDV